MKDDDLYRVELTIGPELQALIGGSQAEAFDPQNDPQKLLTERQQKLVNLLEKDNTLSRAKLADLLEVSPVTIKRELKTLGFIWDGASKGGHWIRVFIE